LISRRAIAGTHPRFTIRERTKLALAAKKASGASPGNPRNLDHAGSLGRAALVRAADEFASGLVPVVQAIRASAGQNPKDDKIFSEIAGDGKQLRIVENHGDSSATKELFERDQIQ
jgi:hypothetical protein